MNVNRMLHLLIVPICGLTSLALAMPRGGGITMANDAPIPEPVGEFIRPEGHAIDKFLFTPDSSQLVGIGLDRKKKQGVIHFWEVKSRKLVRTLVQPDAVAAAVFTLDGKRLVTAGWDNQMRIYSCDKWELEHTFDHDPPRQTANYLAMFPDGKRFISGNVGYQGPRLWDLKERSATRLASPRETVSGVAVSKDGKRFAIAYSAPVTEIWDAEKLEVVGRLKMEVEGGGGRQGVFTSIALSPDGKTIATGCITIKGRPGTPAVRIWDAKTFKLLHESEMLEEHPINIAYTPDSKLLVTNIGPDPSNPAMLYIWEVATGKRVHRFQSWKHGGMRSALSPDGQWLVTDGSDGTTRLWDFAKIRKDIGK